MSKAFIVILIILGFLAGVILSQLWRINQQEIPDWFPPQIIQDLVLVQQNSLIGVSPTYKLQFEVLAVITAYNPVPEQTDSTPDIMASGKKVYSGAIACPKWIPFGTSIEIDGETYICEDRTHPKNDGTFDILMFSKEESKEFGRQTKNVKVY